MIWQVIAVVLVVSLINALAFGLLNAIKKVSIATGKGTAATIKFIFFSPIRFIKWSKQAKRNRKEYKQAREYKKAVVTAVNEYLYGEWAENRDEIQRHELVKGHKENIEALKAYEAAQAKLKELANKKKRK